MLRFRFFLTAAFSAVALIVTASCSSASVPNDAGRDSTTSSAAGVPGAHRLTDTLEGATLATLADGPEGFISVGDNVEGKFTVLKSGDGITWTEIEGDAKGLPAAFAGPYALWAFGDGYMLYGTSGFENEKLLGADPFVATSEDLLAWDEVVLPGIDQMFYGTWPGQNRTGGVSSDGSIALFAGWNRAFESENGGPVLWLVRPGQEPLLFPDSERMAIFVFVKDTPVGMARDASGLPQLFVLNGESWEPIPTPPINLELVPELRAVGFTLVILSTGESWSSPDLGANWTQITTISSAVRSFGYFGAFAAGGPPEPPFGTVETFQVSGADLVWSDVALPDGAVDIRHLASSELGLLTLVEFSSPQRYEALLTPP